MLRTPPRRFNLVDAMVLIAATAVGLALMLRSYHMELKVLNKYPRNFYVLICCICGYIDPIAACFLGPWTLALLALRMSPPRPRPRQLVRQPGVVACAMAGLTLASGFALAVAAWALSVAMEVQEDGFWFVLSGWRDRDDWIWVRSSTLWSFTAWLFRFPGPAVLGSWIMLRLRGRWHCEASWIDRAGRVLGVCWIVHFFMDGIYHILIEKQFFPMP